MSGLGEFLHMGGYGFYVWSAYAITVVVLVANLVSSVRRDREVKRRLIRQLRFEREKSARERA